VTDARVDELLAQLTIEEKCTMVAGRTSWIVPGSERLGIPEWAVSDGPVGVRGRLLGPGLVTPGPSALAATWDPALVHRVGAALGQECLDKHIDLLLAPTVNQHRSPRGGRHFESYSEDPEHSSRIAVGYIQGVQSTGVGTCVKHFVANDQETARFTVDVRVDERTLRELYLPPFEAAVREAGVWAVMGAYNYVNGEQACAHPHLLQQLLKEEWAFKGLVVSDWFAIKETVAPARHGLDLEMPGPGLWWGEGKLLAAVERGEVPVDAVDDKVRRILGFLAWRGRLAGDADHAEAPVERPEHRRLVREAAAASMVLVRNPRALLPLATAATVAVVGPGARDTALLGGGSAQLVAHRRTDVVSALTDRLGPDRVRAALGVDLRRGVAPLPADWLIEPVVLELFDGDDLDGAPFATETRSTTTALWMGESMPDGRQRFSVRLRARFTAPESGSGTVMAAANGHARVLLDGTEVATNADGFPSGLGLRAGTGVVTLEAGRSYDAVLEFRPEFGFPAVAVELGLQPERSGDALLDEAVAVAAEADVAVVVVGSTAEWETEGSDRTSLSLPADQDELVRRVAAANPNTVVVLNCGAPVLLPWIDEVGAVLLAWYPGQEGGEAIADVLLGDADPGGRMPTTWAHREEDTPAFLHFPGEADVVHYGEGIHLGYRWYDARDIEPLLPFGHGGSYATFEWGAPSVSGEGTSLEVRVPITNTSDRAGTEVVQVYVAADEPAVVRPPKELAGFAKVRVPPGDTVEAGIRLRERAFARWDPGQHAWTVDPGGYRLLVAASAVDIRAAIPVTR